MISYLRAVVACAALVLSLGAAPVAAPLGAAPLTGPLGAAPALDITSEPLAIGTLVKSKFAASKYVVVSVEAAVFPRDRVSIGVMDYPFGGPPGGTVARSVVEHVLAALGSGGFTPGRLPDGLLVIDGAVHSPAVANRSGVVGSSRNGDPVVAWMVGADPKNLAYALQGGPFIVDPGGVAGIHRDDGQRARRSIVIESNDAIAVAVTSDCGLYDLMNALLRAPQAFGVDHVDRALNLSGGPSSGLAVRLPNGKVDVVPEMIRIRTVLTVTERRT